MNKDYHMEIEILLSQIEKLRQKLKITLQGLNAIADNGDTLGIAQKTLEALEKTKK